MYCNLNYSSAALPITITCLEKNQKVDRRVTNFVVPIGITVNVDASAIHIAVTAIYIVQSQYEDENYKHHRHRPSVAKQSITTGHAIQIYN